MNYIPGFAAIVCFLFAASTAHAQFPEKDIRVIVGFPPGSAIENSARAFVQVGAKYAKRPLVVFNMPGAAQTVAMSELVRSPADGYTIGISTDGYKALTVLTQKMNFDPNAIRILGGYARFQHVLFVKGDSPYAQYDQFIAHGKANPKAMEYAGSGDGSAPDLIGKVFFRDLKMPATYVPFKGSAEYVQAVMGGHVLSGVIDISGISRQVKAGAVKVVVVFGDQRLAEFPDVPSSKEKGVSDVNALNSIFSVVVHRDTPPERIAFLEDLVKKVAEDAEFRKLATNMQLNAVYTGPKEAAEGMERMRAIGTPLLKQLNLYVTQ